MVPLLQEQRGGPLLSLDSSPTPNSNKPPQHKTQAEDVQEWFRFYESKGAPDCVVVCLSSAFRGTFQEAFELQHFPFDEQERPP